LNVPYKSDKQRRYFHAAEARGEISKATVDEFDRASKGKLPESAPKSEKSKRIEDAVRHAERRMKARKKKK
jgi:hypothetical protein